MNARHCDFEEVQPLVKRGALSREGFGVVYRQLLETCDGIVVGPHSSSWYKIEYLLNICSRTVSSQHHLSELTRPRTTATGPAGSGKRGRLRCREDHETHRGERGVWCGTLVSPVTSKKPIPSWCRLAARPRTDDRLVHNFLDLVDVGTAGRSRKGDPGCPTGAPVGGSRWTPLRSTRASATPYHCISVIRDQGGAREHFTRRLQTRQVLVIHQVWRQHI